MQAALSFLPVKMTVIRSAALFALTCAACVLAYAPGMHGGFMFDDAANLPVLGQFGPVDNLSTFLRYITAGRADPTGRPLSLLSFLLDAHDWPAQAFPFKWHNLALHLLNGLLLGTLLRRLGGILGYSEPQADMAALFAASLWLLHPLFVSTVLYVVQREAMLAAFVVLIGLHIWLEGRERMLAGRGGNVLLILGWLACTALAFLAKPNGLLLPLLSLVIDASLPMNGSPARVAQYRRWRARVAVPCTVLIIAGVTWVLLKSLGHPPPPPRSFTLWQRVITEPTILLEYLRLIFLVDSHYGSLFHDQYRAASNLLSPWWTLPVILTWVGTAAFAWRFRRRWPSLSLAIGFFLGGHLLESSSLALELYFEHRNYLPAMMAFWPIGVAIGSIRTRWLSMTAFAAPLVLCAALTHYAAALWSRPLEQAEVWVLTAPESPRAQAWAAQQELDAGQYAKASARLSSASAAFPGEVQISLTTIIVACHGRGPNAENWEAAEFSLRQGSRDPGPLLTSWTQSAMDLVVRRTCAGMTYGDLAHLLDAAAANPAISALPGRMQDIAHLRGELALAQDDPASALTWFNEGLARVPGPAVALEQAAELGRRGHPREGLAHLAYFDTLEIDPVRPTQGMAWLHAKVLEAQDYWPNEMAHLRRALETDKRALTK